MMMKIVRALIVATSAVGPASLSLSNNQAEDDEEEDDVEEDDDNNSKDQKKFPHARELVVTGRQVKGKTEAPWRVLWPRDRTTSGSIVFCICPKANNRS
jgi:hypothetical protein